MRNPELDGPPSVSTASRPRNRVALPVFLLLMAASTAAQEEATSSARASVFTAARASRPRTLSSELGAVRGTLEPRPSNPQNDNRATPPQSHSDSYWYGRFGYGTIAGELHYGGPTFGFGRRIVHNAFGVDMLLFSGQTKVFGTGPASLHSIDGIYTRAHAASLLTTKALYFVRPRSRTTPYLGGGVGWRTISFKRSFEAPPRLRELQVGGDLYGDWYGSGFEGEFTVGYELARSDTSTRLFVQADFTRPFFRVTRFSRTGDVIGDRHATMLVVSVGAGW